MKEKKPKYGWYVKNLIVGFSIVGLIGLSLTIFGFYFEDWLKPLLIISGIALMILFLWPGLGMGMMNIILSNKNSSGVETKSSLIIKSPIILDVGCGTGRHAIQTAKIIKNGGHLYGIDIYNRAAIGGNALETVQRNAQLEGVDDRTTFRHGSAIEIPFDDEMFDIIYFSSVLHELHMEEGPNKALDEAYRVLKSGGSLEIGEWNRSSWQLIAYCGIFCFVFKKKKHWLNLIEKHGFKIEEQKNKSGFYMFSAIKPKI